jgi:hypothetical protein
VTEPPDQAEKETGWWRAYYERAEGEPAWQLSSRSWEQARSALRDTLAGFLAEQDCPCCLARARDAIAGLDRLSPLESFREDVDGADYVLERERPAIMTDAAASERKPDARFSAST